MTILSSTTTSSIQPIQASKIHIISLAAAAVVGTAVTVAGAGGVYFASIDWNKNDFADAVAEWNNLVAVTSKNTIYDHPLDYPFDYPFGHPLEW